MTLPRQTRRTVLKLTGAGLLGGLTSVGAVTASEEPYDVQVRSVTNATAKYRDIGKALANGYEIMGPYVPDMGFHLVNFKRIKQAERGGTNIRHPQGLTYNLERTLGSVEYIVPLDDDKPDVFNDEGEGLDTSESDGWHPHHSAQHVFANGNGVQDDRSTLSVDELLTNDNWAELSDESPLFPPEVPGLEAGDELTVNWGHQPGDDPETRIVDFVIGPHRDWWTLHAWVHFDNPEGVFAPFNHNEEWDPLPSPPHH
ncbi:hypothetical protein ACH9L7_07035 [Haloferax sp. S1W]|uniref:hypothetical protein n=1 Tax=Haloferax sp. S1W TaxID=3377110 RepID=UPI0037CA4154